MDSTDVPIQEISGHLARVYAETQTHLEVSQIIRDYIADPLDIRQVALEGLDLSFAERILDLGCGFGFFTKGLQGKVHPDAMVTGIDCHSMYKNLYLKACEESGLNGKFDEGGVEILKHFEPGSFDLIICSYAMYFFPEHIRQIASVLTKNGKFVIITHARPHMKDFTKYIRKILTENYFETPETLPYEKLIGNFSNENGIELLAPWFRNIKEKESTSTLVFREADFGDFTRYFNFKKSFFVPCKITDIDHAALVVLNRMKKDLKIKKELSITKEDYIFVCEGVK
ncbi:MAG: methyltransferase domain-containing protein [Bacteroidales bacterium]|nr:methyltransferase domain-containing protein [Bacteroidales bacterium]